MSEAMRTLTVEEVIERYWKADSLQEKVGLLHGLPAAYDIQPRNIDEAQRRLRLSFIFLTEAASHSGWEHDERCHAQALHVLCNRALSALDGYSHTWMFSGVCEIPLRFFADPANVPMALAKRYKPNDDSKAVKRFIQTAWFHQSFGGHHRDLLIKVTINLGEFERLLRGLVYDALPSMEEWIYSSPLLSPEARAKFADVRSTYADASDATRMCYLLNAYRLMDAGHVPILVDYVDGSPILDAFFSTWFTLHTVKAVDVSVR
ncbi:MAG: hypothetical protein Q7R83_02620 [bacterium]|nr:hypothetical protein [bacterium]